MQMRPEIQIQSMIKALTDVVLPAIDPANQLAQEQARLVVGLLSLMRQQLPIQYRFDRDELARLIEFASALQTIDTGSRDSALADSRVNALSVYERAQIEPDELLQAVRDLRITAGALVGQIYRNADAESRARVKALTLAMSQEQLLRDRSLVLSQNWEPDPASLPQIHELLGGLSDRAGNGVP